MECKRCGCKLFGLEWAGPHVKAICSNCGERFSHSSGNSTFYFISVNENEEINEEDKATDSQIKYISSLISKYPEKMSKKFASQIIGIMKPKE